MRNYLFCQVENRGRICVITISRPEVMNALHRPASLELEQVFDDFFNDSELWVAIITGAGEKAFCAGNDLKYQAAGNDTTLPPSGFGGLTGRFQTIKPVIAAVNGICMGGGFEIALACDLIVAAEYAVFALPEPRVGLAAGAGDRFSGRADHFLQFLGRSRRPAGPAALRAGAEHRVPAPLWIARVDGRRIAQRGLPVGAARLS